MEWGALKDFFSRVGNDIRRALPLPPLADFGTIILGNCLHQIALTCSSVIISDNNINIDIISTPNDKRWKTQCLDHTYAMPAHNQTKVRW